MKVNKEMIAEMVTLKKKGLKIHEISKKLNICDRTINRYTNHIPSKNRVGIIKEISSKAKIFSKEKSEILGYLCSEGCEYDKILYCFSYDNRRGKSYPKFWRAMKVTFSNTDKTLQQRFIFLMKKIYDYDLKSDKKGNTFIARQRVIEDLHNYSRFGSKSWSVPDQLFNPRFRKQALYFIRAFCDGDGTIEKKQKEVRIDSTNHRSLIELSDLIAKVGISNKCYRFKDRSRIIIKDTKKYLKLISFIHPNKLNTLKNISAERRNFVTI